tara:strand:+ start:123 stop:275 length:153 start_codon:yes stop_codon:yes gene_type:complete
MPKVQQMKNSLAIVIPAQIARIKGWSKGTELYLSIDERTGKIVMDKQKLP